jgi:hypothetical protein
MSPTTIVRESIYSSMLSFIRLPENGVRRVRYASSLFSHSLDILILPSQKANNVAVSQAQTEHAQLSLHAKPP